MRNNLTSLRLRQPVVHRSVEVVGNLCHLTRGNQCADRNQTAIARREVRTQPQIAEQNVGRVLHDSGRDRAELLLDARRASRFGRLVERQERR